MPATDNRGRTPSLLTERSTPTPPVEVRPMSRFARSTLTRRFCRQSPALLLRCQPARAEVHHLARLRPRPRLALWAARRQHHRDCHTRLRTHLRLRPHTRPRRRPSPSTGHPRHRQTHPRRPHRRSRPAASREALRALRCPDHQASQSVSASLPIQLNGWAPGALPHQSATPSGPESGAGSASSSSSRKVGSSGYRTRSV